jgi:hypothetical protein
MMNDEALMTEIKKIKTWSDLSRNLEFFSHSNLGFSYCFRAFLDELRHRAHGDFMACSPPDVHADRAGDFVELLRRRRCFCRKN